MAETLVMLFGRLGMEDLLTRHGGLSLAPSDGSHIVIAGDLPFRVQGPDRDPIEDSYTIEMHVPPEFPDDSPSVWETGGRIPETYHKLRDGSMCLGAPSELRLQLLLSPKLRTLIEQIVIPYLYGYSYYAQYGSPPFGELAHGDAGLLDHFATLFGVPSRRAAQDCVRLAAMKKRDANKHPCPCESGWRLGRCHNRRVNAVRKRLGQMWLQAEYERFAEADRARAAGTLPTSALKEIPRMRVSSSSTRKLRTTDERFSR